MPEYIQHDPSSTPVAGMIVKKWYSVDPSVVNGLLNILELPRVEYQALTKYKVVDGGIVRNMTQTEKDTLTAYEEAQRDLNIRDSAKTEMDGFQSRGLLLRALADIIKDEINVLRAFHSLPDRTLTQLKTAIQNRIDSGIIDEK